MARRRKRKSRSPEQKAVKNDSGAFNPAFDALASLPQRTTQSPKEPENQVPPPGKRDPDEAHYFLEAMSDVTPLSGSSTKLIRTPNLNKRPAHRARNDELEVLAHLSDLVSGTAEMDITFSDEYIEGSAQGVSHELMKRLKKGQFPIQDYVDLHGLTKQGAEIRVSDFLVQSHRLGFRCVLVVHGRGLNSENHIPVLKERLPIWLSKGPAKKIVLAFSTARPFDGGTGALYILLKRPRAGT